MYPLVWEHILREENIHFNAQKLFEYIITGPSSGINCTRLQTRWRMLCRIYFRQFCNDYLRKGRSHCVPQMGVSLLCGVTCKFYVEINFNYYIE